MIVSVLDCYDSTDGNLLLDLAKHMKWKSSPPSESVHINKKDINEMRKFVTIMSYLKKLFSSLNSDTESTIQKLYPTLLKLVALVDQYTMDSSSSSCSFATELYLYLTKAASYVGRACSEANQDVTDDNGNNGKTMQCVS